MTSSPTLLIMAGGIGSRFGGVKQIEPFGPEGEILLDYAVYDAVRAGFARVIFIIRDEFREDFRRRIEPTIAKHCRVEYVVQRLETLPGGEPPPAGRRKPWGTAHAVLSCKGQVTGAFGVINADDFYGRESFERLYAFLRDVKPASSLQSAALIGYPLENTLTDHGDVSRGVCRVAPDGTLEEICERKRIRRFGRAVRFADSDSKWRDLDPGTIVSMNMWGFPGAMMDMLETRWEEFVQRHREDLATAEFLLPNVVGEWVHEGRATVRVLPTSASWFGVTYPEDRARVEGAIRALIEAGEYPTPVWSMPTR